MPPEPNKTTFSLLQVYRGWAALLVILVHATAIADRQFESPFLGNYFQMSFTVRFWAFVTG